MTNVIDRLHDAIKALLADRGDHGPISPTESLFISGRLDSLAATEMIVLLETEFGIDVGSADFDVSSLDTLEEMEQLVMRVSA